MFGLSSKEVWFIAFGLLSFLVLIVGMLLCIILRKKMKEKFGATSWQIFMGVAFVAAFFMYCPVFFAGTDMGGGINVLRPIFMSIFDATRVFIIDGDFQFLLSSLEGVAEWLSAIYCLYATLLFILCPFLTAQLLLFVFRSFISQIQYGFIKNKSIYIMSELNAMSVALAESIYDCNCVKCGEKECCIEKKVANKKENQTRIYGLYSPMLTNLKTKLKESFLKEQKKCMRFV